MDQKADSLEDIFTSLLARRKEKSQFRQLTLVGPDKVDFSSNSYLSLSGQSKIHNAYLAFLKEWSATCSSAEGQSFLGSGGSRLLDGNSEFAERLECTIAAFHGAPAALLFNSGFDANVGLFSTVPQPGDVLVYDELIHASVHDGMRLSRATQRIPFRHNSVFGSIKDTADQLKGLDAVLGDLAQGEAGNAVLSGKRNVFIAIEGVYSMDGDVSPLREIVASVEARLPHGNGYIIIDEAHSTGIIGKSGKGLVCDLGLENKIFARVHTFGKAIGCSGAAVLTSPTTRAYLVNYARTLIYTTAMGLPSLASIKVAYDFLARGDADPLITHVNELIAYTYTGLQSVCDRSKHDGDILHLAEKRSGSPIIPLFTAEPRSLARHCQQRGFMVRPIVAPTVPRGTERIRICLHAANTKDEVDGLFQAIEEWLQNRSRISLYTNETSVVVGSSLEEKARL